MSYAKENLVRGERIIYTTSLHWVTFLESFSVLIIGLAVSFLGAKYKDILGSLAQYVQFIALGVLAFGGIKFLLELIRHRSSEFVVTSDRVIVREGVLNRTSTSMPLSKIESIEVDQSILGRMMNYGSINITGTGTAESKFDLITNPHKFRKKMEIASGSGSDEVREEEFSNTTGRRRRRRR